MKIVKGVSLLGFYFGLMLMASMLPIEVVFRNDKMYVTWN